MLQKDIKNLVAENIKKVKIEPAAYKNNKYSTYRNSCSRVGLLRYTVYLRNLSNLLIPNDLPLVRSLNLVEIPFGMDIFRT